MEQQAELIRQKKQDRYLKYRISILPNQLDAAYRKVDALEREAERLGFSHLIREKRS